MRNSNLDHRAVSGAHTARCEGRVGSVYNVYTVRVVSLPREAPWSRSAPLQLQCTSQHLYGPEGLWVSRESGGNQAFARCSGFPLDQSQ